VVLLNKYIFKYNFFFALKRQRNIKFWCMLLLGIHMGTWIVYDFVTFLNIYVVGTDEDYGIESGMYEGLRRFADVLLNFTFTAHSSSMFLLLSFWHSLFNSTKQFQALNFWKAWEFKLYVAYSMISVVIYPAVQFSLINDDLLFVVVPQLMYLGEMMISSGLILFVRYRMRRLERLESSVNLTRSNLVDILSWLMIALVACNLLIGWSINIINIALLADYRLGDAADDFLTSIFSTTYMPMVIFSAMCLNVTAVVPMVKMKLEQFCSRASSSTRGGSGSVLLSTATSRSPISDGTDSDPESLVG
jgi:hypothetical protein